MAAGARNLCPHSTLDLELKCVVGQLGKVEQNKVGGHKLPRAATLACWMVVVASSERARSRARFF